MNETPRPAFRFLPGAVVVPPFAAQYQEPRVGLRKEIGSSKMKLDIGSTLDILEVVLSHSGSQRVRFGVDFFTYFLTASARGLRLQVDAADGYFGGHLVFADERSTRLLAVRLRILHLSSHMIDGHFDPSLDAWKGGRQPIPYTRDFGELTGITLIKVNGFSIRGYAGFTYSTLVRPDSLARWGALLGCEIASGDIIGNVLEKPATPYLAYHLNIAGIPTMVGTHSLEVGVKFGEWNGTGIKLYGSYYSGLDVFCQYFDQRTEQWGIGFAFDFW